MQKAARRFDKVVAFFETSVTIEGIVPCLNILPRLFNLAAGNTVTRVAHGCDSQLFKKIQRNAQVSN